jgi:CHAT domain-containing protein
LPGPPTMAERFHNGTLRARLSAAVPCSPWLERAPLYDRLQSRMVRIGGVARAIRAQYLRFVWVVVLCAGIPLKDTRPGAAQAAYNFASDLCLHGHLADCQREAADDSRRFQISDPRWSDKLQLLEAQAMVWRGMLSDALALLSATHVLSGSEDAVQKLALEGAVFTRLQRFSAADEKLQEAERLCKTTKYGACGNALRARGVLALDRGDIETAHRFFLQSLSYARSHRDRFLEATSLLNLGVTGLQSERFDDASDWSKAARRVALEIGAEDVAQAAAGNLGWANFELGDHQTALNRLLEAEKQATKIGDLRLALKWLENIGYVYQIDGDPERAEPVYRQALALARHLDLKQDIVISMEDLAYAAIETGEIKTAKDYLDQLEPLVHASNSRLDALSLKLARAKIEAAGHQPQAENLFRAVETDSATPTLFQLDSEQSLAQLYEAEGHAELAEAMYRRSLATFESARAQLKSEESRLPFLANAESVYDSYIHLLVHHDKADEALAVADQSRAQTLAEGIGVSTRERASQPSRLNARSVAQGAHAIVLFYWLGKQESYLWAITPANVELFTLPPEKQIAGLVERYRTFLLTGKDPLADNNPDAQALYATLVAPIAPRIRSGSNMVICVDGALSKLNFETLVAPGASADPEATGSGHYWLDDVAVVSAPSLSMLAAARAPRVPQMKLLMIGDAVSPAPDYPELPLAGTEMKLVKQHFTPSEETVFARGAATPASYLSSNPQRYAYIHFVAHGTASQADPLESAIVLSPDLRDQESFKLYARDIIRQPLDARLVTISACYGSGARTYLGEGLVGLSWSFLRAGAHNVIGALWDVSDESTPRMMNLLYQGIANGLAPSAALRKAKLELLRSGGEFQKPFYWAPFQLYTGR